MDRLEVPGVRLSERLFVAGPENDNLDVRLQAMLALEIESCGEGPVTLGIAVSGELDELPCAPVIDEQEIGQRCLRTPAPMPG